MTRYTQGGRYEQAEIAVGIDYGTEAGRAVLLKKHSVCIIGETAETAAEAAVIVEDIARTVWITLQLGQPEEILPDDVVKLRVRYTQVCGQ